MTEPARCTVNSAGVNLNVLVFGDATLPPLVMLHGMRDVALSLMPIASKLADHFQIVLPDLRGHGSSDRPGGYAMHQFLFDLHRINESLLSSAPVLFGHSLGGQIATRYAAMFPEGSRAAVVVEGLGPPAHRHNATSVPADLAAAGQRLVSTLSMPATLRPLPGVDFAAERLLANNPRLDPGYALTLARQATHLSANGELHWSFDPRVSSVFLSAGDSERYWPAVRCPTLIVTGDHAHEYWAGAVPGDAQWDGAFEPGELEGRVAAFPNAEHVRFDGSGHMVHFDQPDRLADVTLEFLRRLT